MTLIFSAPSSNWRGLSKECSSPTLSHIRRGLLLFLVLIFSSLLSSSATIIGDGHPVVSSAASISRSSIVVSDHESITRGGLKADSNEQRIGEGTAEDDSRNAISAAESGVDEEFDSKIVGSSMNQHRALDSGRQARYSVRSFRFYRQQDDDYFCLTSTDGSSPHNGQYVLYRKCNWKDQQLWFLSHEGYMKPKSNRRLCLVYDGSPYAYGNQLKLRTCPSRYNSSYRWYQYTYGDIRPVKNGASCVVPRGSRVVLDSCGYGGSTSTKWNWVQTRRSPSSWANDNRRILDIPTTGIDQEYYSTDPTRSIKNKNKNLVDLRNPVDDDDNNNHRALQSRKPVPSDDYYVFFRDQKLSSGWALFCLTLKGPPKNHAHVYYGDCGDFKDPRYWWLLTSDGYIRSAMNHNLCLVYYGSAVKGKELILYDCPNHSSHSYFQWKHYDDGEIRPSRNTSTCVEQKYEVSDGWVTSKVILDGCNDGYKDWRSDKPGRWMDYSRRLLDEQEYYLEEEEEKDLSSSKRIHDRTTLTLEIEKKDEEDIYDYDDPPPPLEEIEEDVSSLNLNMPKHHERVGCFDDPIDWKDGDGTKCDWYSSDVSNCETFGYISGSNGVSAEEACCACGGGYDLSKKFDHKELLDQETEGGDTAGAGAALVVGEQDQDELLAKVAGGEEDDTNTTSGSPVKFISPFVVVGLAGATASVIILSSAL